MKLKLFVAAGACALAFLSAGCYTQLAVRGSSDDDRYADDEDVTAQQTDTTGGTIVNNYYFGDDAYRHARFRMAFHYYSPYRWGTYGMTYDPFFDDPWYWSDGWRSGVLYPYPTWYPDYGYYGNRYWGYYGDPYYYNPWVYSGGYYGVGRPGYPHRTREMGSTRGGDRFNTHSRTPMVTPAGSVGSSGSRATGPTGGYRTRTSPSDDRGASATSTPPSRSTTTRTRGNDTPWWNRGSQSGSASGTSNGSGSRIEQSTNAAETVSPGQSDRRQRHMNQSGSRQGPSTQSTTQGTTDHPRRQRSGDAPAGGRQQHAAPAAQTQSQPHYSPPANSGGGRERSGGSSSSGGGSRSRDGR